MFKIAFLLVAVVSGLACARPLRGKYLVPTTESDLVPFSSFNTRLEAKEESYENFSALQFPLPQAVTGRKILVDMKYDATTKTWGGPQIDNANCERVGRYLECSMKFQDLKIDSAEVTAHLASLPIEANERDLMSRLAQVFSNEPAGVLCYRLRGKPARQDSGRRHRGGDHDSGKPTGSKCES